ncbi:MAG TPA: NUDIX hydrolase [Solirubrobacteraceae bacterium]|nr:NUDIX hydrolase [Solirubrobacteraceae bacterium]
MSSRFDKVDSETVWQGQIGSVRVERFRHEDSEVVMREVVAHPGAVAIVAHDGEDLWLVRQPREAVGVPDLLELPAGKLDEPGEDPLETAKRELAEEIGKAAQRWEHLTTYYASPGFSDEQVHVYLATELSDADADSVEDERIEIVKWPLVELNAAIDECRDAKSLIGLLWLAARS